MTQPDTTNSQPPSSSSAEIPPVPDTHPDVASERLFGNFISLFDAIEAVARRVEIANETVDAYRDTDGDVDAFTTTLNRWPVKTIFQRSAAATQLIQRLANGPAHERPRWFDTTLGFPLVRDVVAEEGMTELALMVRWAENHKRQFSARNMGRRWGAADLGAEYKQPINPEPDPFEIPRIREIGFDCDELIRFLDRNGISYYLQSRSGRQSDTAADLGVVTESDADRQPPGQSATSARPSMLVPGVDESSAEVSIGVLVHKIDDERIRRNRLDAVIDDAIKLAGGTYATNPVWLELKELALSGKPPFTGAIHDGCGDGNQKLNGGLVYDQGRGKPVGALTEDRLESRLIRRWKKEGNKLPRR
jgi:hypothetical protein